MKSLCNLRKNSCSDFIEKFADHFANIITVDVSFIPIRNCKNGTERTLGANIQYHMSSRTSPQTKDIK